MRKSKQITIHQRESELIELIQDAEEMGFNGNLIKGYKSQLNQIQAEIKKDKEKLNSHRVKKGES